MDPIAGLSENYQSASKRDIGRRFAATSKAVRPATAPAIGQIDPTAARRAGTSGKSGPWSGFQALKNEAFELQGVIHDLHGLSKSGGSTFVALAVFNWHGAVYKRGGDRGKSVYRRQDTKLYFAKILRKSPQASVDQTSSISR